MTLKAKDKLYGNEEQMRNMFEFEYTGQQQFLVEINAHLFRRADIGIM